MQLAASPDSPVARRLGTLVLGLALVGVGVAMMIRAELGVAPFDVLTTGVAHATGMGIGLAAVVVPFAFAVAGWRLGRRPGPGTVIATVLVGPIIGAVLSVLSEHEAMAPRLALFTVGFLVVVVGVTAVIIAEIGPGPAELVMLAIHDKGRPLVAVRTGIEVFCVAVGWALGGQVGVGTIAVALLTGPMLRRTLVASGFDSTRRAEAAEIASPGL